MKDAIWPVDTAFIVDNQRVNENQFISSYLLSSFLWWSVLLVEETREPGENHRPAELTLVAIGTDFTGSCNSNDHANTTTVTPNSYGLTT